METEIIEDKWQELSLDELSILYVTNDGDVDYNELINKPGLSELVLTTKDFYFYAVIIAKIVNKYPDVEIDYYQLISLSIQESYRKIESHYAEISHILSHNHYVEHRFLRLIIQNLNILFSVKIDYHELDNNVQETYRKLVNKDYIVDPIFTSIGGVALAILGLIPVGFSKKTRKGKSVMFKLNATLWSYEKTTDLNGDTQTDITFKLMKSIDIFKSAFVNGIREVISKTEK